MLGHDCHSIVAGEAHANAIINQLKNYKEKGYTLILSSHYVPETQKDVDTKIAYLENLKKIAKESTNSNEFKDKVKAENLDADIFEIVPVDEYTSDDLDWTDNNSRTSREHDDESLRNVELVSTTVENWDSYDTVLIGYPIWWGIAAWPVDTFVKANDFTEKTVIPFCTSSSSGLGQSGRLLEEDANSGNWLEGHRFRSNPSDSDIDSFTDSL